MATKQRAKLWIDHYVKLSRKYKRAKTAASKRLITKEMKKIPAYRFIKWMDKEDLL